MLYVSSTLLLLVNAVTFRRVISILFNRVAILILLFSGIVWCYILNIALLDTSEDIYGGLFHSSKTHSFALFLCIIRAIVFFSVYYPRRSKKSMGAMGKKISSFLLTKFTDSYFYLFKNSIIKMREKFIILKFTLIVLFILIGGIFLISSSYLVSMFLSIKFNSYVIYIFEHYIEIMNSLLQWGYIGFTDTFLLAALIPIKTYSNAEVEKKSNIV